MKAAAIMVGVAMCLLAGGTMADEPKEKDQGSFWMQKKLEYSEKILAGLAKEDFEAIAANARSMNALNQMEKWVRAGLPEYRAQLRIFQNANEQLIGAADDRQLDGAALAYVQLTLSCVNCHKVVRASPSEKPSRAP
jgi:cytochrome c556